MAEPPADPEQYQQAVDWHRKRVPVTDAEWHRLVTKSHDRAFKVAGVQQAKLAQEVFDEIDRAISDGTTLEDFKESVGDKLSKAWGGDDAPRMEMVFRTNVLHAYNAGRHEVFRSPAVREARPYLRFDATEDSRVSEICGDLDGTVLPADDPFWSSHTPPLHPNCRSILTPLDPEEADGEGIDDAPEPDSDVSDGFGKQPGAADDYEPDIGGFDAEIRRVLAERLK